MKIQRILQQILTFLTFLERFVKTTPAPDVRHTPVGDLILAQNQHQLRLVPGPVYVNVLKGSKIHKIDQTTANAIGELVEKEVDGTLPLPYLLACLAIESAFDPKAENGNFLGSNKDHRPDGYDMGIAQLKLKYIDIQPYNIELAKDLALDPSKAIPMFATRMRTDLKMAEKFISLLKPNSVTNPKAGNKYFTATVFYNFGITGGSNLILKGGDIHHGDTVAIFETRFAKTLNLPSVMEDISH